MTNPTNNCEICGADALSETHDHSFFFRHGRKIREVKGLSQTKCSACGVAMFLPHQLKQNNQSVREFQAGLDDYISPEQVLELREKYGITQADANKIFGGGPTAFSKYERGISNPTASASRQMLAALNDSDFMRNIAKKCGIAINASVPINACEALIDTLPAEIRSQVEQYSGNLRMSRWDACLLLLSKGLEVAKSKSAETWAHEVGVNYAVDYEYAVQSYNVVSKQPSDASARTKFITPVKRTNNMRGRKNA